MQLNHNKSNNILVIGERIKPRNRFLKEKVNYRARKAVLETKIRLPWKAALLICFLYVRKGTITAKFQSFKRVFIDDCKGIYVTRRVSGFSRNGPHSTRGKTSRSNPKTTHSIEAGIEPRPWRAIVFASASPYSTKERRNRKKKLWKAMLSFPENSALAILFLDGRNRVHSCEDVFYKKEKSLHKK